MIEEHEHYPEYAYHWEDAEVEKRTKADVYMTEVPIPVLKTAIYSTLAALIDSWEQYDDPDAARTVFGFCELLAFDMPDEDRLEMKDVVKEAAQTIGVWW